MLHVTNGDSTAVTIAECGLGGTVLPWHDVLHDGPVPPGLDDDELREVRARFLANRGWGIYEEVLADFVRRDETLDRFPAHEEVVLWFEHDLYDQLQILQILDRFAEQSFGTTRLSMICVGAFPGVTRFTGLGQLSRDQLSSLFPRRRPVTTEQIDLARAAWTAVRSPDPTAIERLLAGDTRPLPFLRGALVRHLEEFPSLGAGLSQTERQTLAELEDGTRTAAELFRAVSDREERPYLGDLSYWNRLASLASGAYPLLAPVASPPPERDATFDGRQRLAITDHGRAVVSGRADRIALNGINRWIGGVQLMGQSVRWRWDAATTPPRLRRVADRCGVTGTAASNARGRPTLPDQPNREGG